MALIAAAFGPRTMAEALDRLPRLAAGGADAVELRLDLFEEPYDLAALLRARGDLPAIVTLRATDQGGRCTLPARARLAVLQQAAALGAEFVDVEWNAASPAVVERLKRAGAQRVIVSRHDFTSMPGDLSEIWCPDLAARGADVVKVVGTATDARDGLAAFRALAEATLPTIALAMGEAGLPTRLLGPRWPTCFLTFGAVDQGGGTAPGQVSLAAMRGVYRVDHLGPNTAIYGLLTSHADVSLAERYNDLLRTGGLDAMAVPFATAHDAGGVVEAYRRHHHLLPVRGWLVDGAAHQANVAAHMDHLDAPARRRGQVNAVTVVAPPAGTIGRPSLHGAWVEPPEAQVAVWAGALVA